MWSETVTAGSGPGFSQSFSGNDNRIDGWSYDAAGNLLSDGSHTYAYDAEDELVSVDNGALLYAYDAEGARAYQWTPDSANEDYVRDYDGSRLAAWQWGSTPVVYPVFTVPH
jgi:uncharacterized protein RhaS with RHS repeats